MAVVLDGDNLATTGVINSATAKTATGTAVDFTGIPAGTKRITVMFNGVSTNGTSDFGIRLGASGGVQSTGYSGSTVNTATSQTLPTSAAQITYTGSATAVAYGQAVILLVNSSTNTWVIQGSVLPTGYAYASISGYSVSLSGTLTSIRITSMNGTDTFDAGSINILYE